MDNELIVRYGSPVNQSQHRREHNSGPADEFHRRSQIAEMDIVRRSIVFVRVHALKLLLAISVFMFIGQFNWPTVIHWWRLPTAGHIGFDAFRADTFADEFMIQLPPTYGRGQLWPLVVFLHGSGERRNNPNILRSQPVFRQKLPAIVIAPQCLMPFNWDPIAVKDLIGHVASRYQVDRRRIYLVGFSMGGNGTWQTAAAYPELFAAIVPISGGGDPDAVKTLTGTPIWAFHGEYDKVAPVEQTERTIDAIRKAGGQPRMTILPAGHSICQTVCERSDLWEWLLSKSQ